LAKGVKEGDKGLLGRFQPGSSQGAFASQLKPGERLYVSTESDEASVIGTSSIRFVFDKVNQDFQMPEQSGASILLTKFMRDPRAADKTGGVWLPKPVIFKPKPGEALGEKGMKVVDPFSKNKDLTQEDLSTPFVLTEVKLKVKRVIYYEISEKSRPMGGKAKDLDLNTKEIETEVAVLTNTQTGTTLNLPRCERVNKPNKPRSVFFPDFSGTMYNELEEFKKNPANFKQRELIPTAPIRHEPGTGPLQDLFKRRNNPLLQTDTPYYELADGRLVYWEHINNRLEILIRPGSEAAADAQAAAKELEEKAAAEAAEKAAAAAAEAEKKPGDAKAPTKP
jgi:hypothetical protein